MRNTQINLHTFRLMDDEPVSFMSKVYDWLSFTMWRIFIACPKSIICQIRDAYYLLKTKQTYRASWSIDETMLDVLAHNLPILKKNKQCLSWKMLDKAILEKYGDVKDFNLQKYYETHRSGYGDEIENRSVELEHQLFDQLLNDIEAYRYYSDGYLWIDQTDPIAVAIDKKLHSTIPLIDDTDIYDNKKLNDMTTDCWNRIWDAVKTYGREFNY